MKSGTVTKLLFTGVASGIALSCAIVLATSVATVSSEKSDKSIVYSAADPKADRVVTPAVDQEVDRKGKSDALAITLAILKGDNILTDDPAPFDTEPEAGVINAPETAAIPFEKPIEGLRLTRVPDDREIAKPEVVAAPVETKPVTRTRTVTITETIGEPVSIVPDAEPVENRPVAAPTTTTNFTTEPVTSQQSLHDRSDLAR